jgi:hypothetical protein
MAGSDPTAQHDDDTDQQEQPTPAAEAPATPVETPAESPSAADEDGGKRGAKRKQSTARKTRTVELTLTVTGTAEGEWQADLVHGTTRVVRGLSIPASAVARAAKELSSEISDGIETVLSAAREQHRSRMEQLEAELEQVKKALAELTD